MRSDPRRIEGAGSGNGWPQFRASAAPARYSVNSIGASISLQKFWCDAGLHSPSANLARIHSSHGSSLVDSSQPNVSVSPALTPSPTSNFPQVFLSTDTCKVVMSELVLLATLKWYSWAASA